MESVMKKIAIEGAENMLVPDMLHHARATAAAAMAASSSTASTDTDEGSGGASFKKRTCEELNRTISPSSPLSNKKTKDGDCSDYPPPWQQEGGEDKVGSDIVLSSSSIESLSMDDDDNPDSGHKIGIAAVPLSVSANTNGCETAKHELGSLKKSDSECASQSPSNQYPMRDIKLGETTDSDVMLGRADQSYPGNARFKKFLEDNKSRYLAAKRNERAQIALQIIQQLRTQNPPGRFLTVSAHALCYHDVGDEFMRKKIIGILGKGSHGNKSNKKDAVENSPHCIDSMYNDVLGFFASTPFDSEAMHSLREQKKGYGTAVPKESLVILPSRANLPIVSQKQFMNTKVPPTAADEKEVAKFLLEEAKNLAEVAVPTQRKNAQLATSADGAPQRKISLDQSVSGIDNSEAGSIAVGTGKENNATKANINTLEQIGSALNPKVTKPNLRVSIGGCTSEYVPLVTPKTPKTPNTMSSTSSNTPKTPKTPAVLLSTNTSPNGLPEGWTTKTFQRMSGKSSGHKDTYFYSPHKIIKFRAMKGCREFLNILDESEVDGNEQKALQVFKERGHRL